MIVDLYTYIHTYINSIYKTPFHIDHGAEMEIKQIMKGINTNKSQLTEINTLYLVKMGFQTFFKDLKGCSRP